MTTVALKAHATRLERHNAHALVAVHRGLRSGARAGRTHLVRVTPKDRGMAKAAWKEHNGPMNSRPPTPAAWLENSAPYIGILEKGARPHPVSPEGRLAIYEWVLRNMRAIPAGAAGGDWNVIHGNAFISSSSTGKRIGSVSRLKRAPLTRWGSLTSYLIIGRFPHLNGTLNATALNISGAICRKINLYGSKPHYFVRDSMELLAKMAQGEVERCLREMHTPRGGVTT
jgi:hypothetical protein